MERESSVVSLDSGNAEGAGQVVDFAPRDAVVMTARDVGTAPDAVADCASGDEVVVAAPGFNGHLAGVFEGEIADCDKLGVGHGDERRAAGLAAYNSGEVTVLCNCEVLTKGWDAPDVEVAIIARPTKSLSKHIQMLGRVLRFDGEKVAKIIDQR